MDIDDKALFDAAISKEPAPAAPVTEAEPDPATEQPAIARDEQGRFAPKSADEAAEKQPAEPATAEAAPTTDAAEANPGKPGLVPSSRLKEEADLRRAEKERADRLEQMLAQMLQQQARANAPETPDAPKPDIWDDPDNWLGAHVAPVRSEVQQTREFFSRRLAEQTHGADKVKEAYDALDAALRSGALPAQQVKSQLMQSMDPYGDIMGWYESTAPIRDPEGFKRKIIEEYEASRQNQQPTAPAQGQAPASVVRIPTSLNRTTSGAPNTPSEALDMSDAALFQQALRR